MTLDTNERTPIVEQCMTASIDYVTDPKDKDKKIPQKVKCRRINGQFCSVYLWPDRKWRSGCPMSEKVVREETTKKINPLKASKRASAGQS